MLEGLPTTVPSKEANLPNPAEYIKKEFGPDYVLDPSIPPLLGDLDGDGEEDAVFAVTGGNPMMGGGAFNFKVIDPFTSYWALGNPSYTKYLGHLEPGPRRYVLIAHSWRSANPSPKFAIINLPFVKLSLTPTFNKKKKKTVAAIIMSEREGQTGAILWKGKDYKYVPLGSNED